ncbi:MAG: hypothetical protein KGQ66_21595, partial [Acidobacteriota bacterium]|nr:hypothetical protein [Acidobacteriota bacterium]
MVTAGSHPGWRAVLAGSVASASGIGLLATSGWLITTASTRPPVLALAVAIGAVQAFALGRGLARYFERLGIHASALDRLGRLRLALFDDLQGRVPGVPGLDSSSVLTGFVSDAETVTDEWAKVATGLIDLVSGVLLGTAVVAVVDPALGLRLLVGALAIAAAAVLTARLSRNAFVGEAQARRDLARAVTEAVGAAREMAAYGRQDLTQQQLATVRLRSVAAARRMGAWAAVGTAAAVALSALALVSLLQVGLEGAAGRRVGGVTLSVVVFTALAVLDQCASLPGLLLGRQRAGAAADRLAAVSAAPVPVAEPVDPSWSDPERVGGVSYDGVRVSAG